MFEMISPEQAGIASSHVEAFIRSLNRCGLATHSVLLMRGERVFGEFYWKPFHRDFCHRMYSQTKSFVAIAIGFLLDDGKISLDDRVAEYFPDKADGELPTYLKAMTVRDMLRMSTCGRSPSWFKHEDADRVHLYFNENTAHVPSGMRFEYDSPGSEVLSVLVERLSGQTLFDFLNDRLFKALGTFKTASILKTRTEDSFGDSAMLCTARDMASFARFVMNYGQWHGKRLLSEAYLREATSPLADNDETGFDDLDSEGYGYLIWCLGEKAFFFNGMGGQLTFCLPEQDLIFAITGDNQGYPSAKSLILRAFYEHIVDNLRDEPLPPDEAAAGRCLALGDSLELVRLAGNAQSDFAAELDGIRYRCEENPTGITEFFFRFAGDGTGEWHYRNAQGDKVLAFGLGKNVFGKFPQYGYSGDHAGARTTDGSLYDCAVSASWRERQKLLLKVQIIDRYLGNMLAMFSFREDTAVVRMSKTAEDFLDEYQGEFVAHKIDGPAGLPCEGNHLETYFRT